VFVCLFVCGAEFTPAQIVSVERFFPHLHMSCLHKHAAILPFFHDTLEFVARSPLATLSLAIQEAAALLRAHAQTGRSDSVKVALVAAAESFEMALVHTDVSLVENFGCHFFFC
jgi:hypothetical protein